MGARYTTPWVPTPPPSGDPRQKDNPIAFGADANPKPQQYDAQGGVIGQMPKPDFDQTQPGVGEKTAAGVSSKLFGSASAQESAFNPSEWSGPTNVGGYWQGVSGQFNGGGPMVSNTAQTAYDSYMKAMPEISPDANMGAYYDNARSELTNDVNQQLGARGAFNSSAALNSLSQGYAKIGAEQARDEAQYGIDRASTLGNLYSIGGNLASGADSSSATQASTKLDYLKGGADIAAGADRTKLEKLLGKSEAAGSSDAGMIGRLSLAAETALGSQAARDSRIQMAFKNISGFGEQLGKVAETAYSNILGGDMSLMDAALSGEAAKVAEALNISEADANKIMGDLKSVFEVVAAAGKVK